MKPYYQDSYCTIYHGDCIEVMAGLDRFVQCVVTSPPYGGMRRYNGFFFDFHKTALAISHLLEEGGVICWNVSDEVIDGSETLDSCNQKIFFAHNCGLRVHDTMIYEKLNFSAPEKVRYHNNFEYIFIFSNGAPRTFNAIKDRKNVYAGETLWGKNTKRQVDGSVQIKNKAVYAEYGMRSNVWKGKTRGQEEGATSLPHPAMMPKWLASDLIASWSDPGDTVLDPLMGSGTTLVQAKLLNRKAIGIDSSEKYCEIAARALQQEVLPL